MTVLNGRCGLYFYLDIMRKIREAMKFGNWSGFFSELQARFEAGPSPPGMPFRAGYSCRVGSWRLVVWGDKTRKGHLLLPTGAGFIF